MCGVRNQYQRVLFPSTLIFALDLYVEYNGKCLSPKSISLGYSANILEIIWKKFIELVVQITSHFTFAPTTVFTFLCNSKAHNKAIKILSFFLSFLLLCIFNGFKFLTARSKQVCK